MVCGAVRQVLILLEGLGSRVFSFVFTGYCFFGSSFVL